MSRPLLRNEIKRLLFLHDTTRLVIVENNDGFLLREDVCCELSYLHIVVARGDRLDLRVLYETRYKTEEDLLFVFVMSEAFKIAPDIAKVAELTSFVASKIFKRYKWSVLQDATIPALEWLLTQRVYTNLSEYQTSEMVREYENSSAAEQEKISNIKEEWKRIVKKADFNKPGPWIPEIAKLICRALAINQWDQMCEEVALLNGKFQEFMKDGYLNIVSSSIPPKDRAPRIVTQVLEFMAKQDEEKTALIVVDGMNYWQAILLGEAIKKKLDIEPKYDCIYSWIPSITELSRQAIFRGGRPDVEYPQNPHNEEKLWKEFWDAKHLPEYSQEYQYEGFIDYRQDVTKQAYVTLDLDKMMHASKNYRYLYRNTTLWVEERELMENLRTLKENGFKVFITTDHGNIETEELKNLKSSEKVGAKRSMRHITLPEEADPQLFINDWKENVIQLPGQDRTFCPIGNKVFSGLPTPVTHGGTHWLEVLIPFMTI